MTASPHSVRPWRTSAGLATLLGFIVPGLGHVYLGRYGKALLFFAVILATYVFGLWLADWRCVHYERYQVWFFAQAFAAGPTALTAWLTQGLEVARDIPQFDEGQLYVGVAALLNAVAVADAIGCAQEALDERALELEAAQELARAAALEAEFAAPAPAPPPSHPTTAVADEWPPPPPAAAAGDLLSGPPAPPEPAEAAVPLEAPAAAATDSWLFDAPPAGLVAPPAPPPERREPLA